MDLLWLATAIIGALVTIIIYEGYARTRDWRLERSNSIRGDYVTSTIGSTFRGPPEQAPTETIRRKLSLAQRGHFVRGVETGKHENDVRWELRGEVIGEFVVGTYRQTSPPSLVNVGTFHLERDSRDSKVYRGLWLGWNPEKRDITSGRYEWTRIMPEKSP